MACTLHKNEKISPKPNGFQLVSIISTQKVKAGVGYSSNGKGPFAV